eukprot:8202778-Alexandrium_andersonii.AAC.1
MCRPSVRSWSRAVGRAVAWLLTCKAPTENQSLSQQVAAPSVTCWNSHAPVGTSDQPFVFCPRRLWEVA